MELHEATIEELLAEVVNRTTFCGVVAWKMNYRADGDYDGSWRVVGRDCDFKDVLGQIITKSKDPYDGDTPGNGREDRGP